jgi:NitT/TauT family transport system substrate-binding protein
MLLRANEDARIKVIAPIYAGSPAAVLFYEDQNIRSPTDLEGRTLADAVGSSPRVLFPAFAGLTGIDTSRVNWRSIDVSVRNTLMGNGQLEIITAFISNLAEIERQAYSTNPDRRIGVMMYRDYGLDIYGNGFIVGDRLIQERPEVVAGFVKATARALRETYQDIPGAVRIVKRYHPEVDVEVGVRQLELLKDLVFTEDILANGLATFQTERLQKTYDVMAQYFGMRRDVPLNKMYTTQFAPDPPIKP